MPAVSVIVAARNPGDYLREAVRSVVSQTFTDWELIVVDDGSDEDLSWVPLADPRVSLVCQGNQGVSAARNRGIAVSRARFIAFLDQDDRWRPAKLERQVELLRAGSVFCHTAFDIIDGGGSRVGPGWGGKVSYLDMLAGRHGTLLSSSMVDRAVLQRVGLFDPGLRMTQDFELFLRLGRSYEFSYLPTVEVDYRLHPGNASKDYWQCFAEFRDLFAREARLGESRNDMPVRQAIHEGEPRVRRTCAFQAIDAARSAARRHRALDTAGHLARATWLSPGAVRQSSVLLVKRRLFSGGASSTWVTLLPAVLTLVLGGAFLGRASMWTDEAATWFVSGQPASHVIRSSIHTDGMFHLPYYLLMHFWLGAGQSLWWMRLPSLLAGAGTVHALALLARRWLPLGWSVLAGLLLALNPLFAGLALEARPYTGAALFAVLSTAALVNAIDRGGRRPWALYGLASLCMLLLHLLAVFVLAAQLAGVAIARRRSALAGMASAIGCVAVLISPLAVIVARQGQMVSWIGPSTLGTFREALKEVSGGRPEELVLVACAIIVAASLARTPPAGDRALGLALCLAWGAVPGLLLVSAGLLRPLFVARYAAWCLPGIALIEAQAGWRVSAFVTAEGRTWRAFALAGLACGAAGVAGLALLATTGSGVLHSRYWGDDYRSAAAELSSDMAGHPAPIAVAPDYAGVGFSYYATPPALARALSGQATRDYDRHLIDWQGMTLTPGNGEPIYPISVVGWPSGARPAAPAARCAAGWAIGRGGVPSGAFIVAGSSCRVRWIRHYGGVWVASLSS